MLSARVEEGQILGWSRCCLPIWSKKQIESAGTVVQSYVGGLLQLGSELPSYHHLAILKHHHHNNEYNVDNNNYNNAQQTFLLMKVSWRSLSSLSSRHLDQDECICLSYTSSEETFIKKNKFVLVVRLQDAFKIFFKTSSRRLAITSSRRFEDVFKAFCKSASRHLQDVFKTFQRRLQDIFKTSPKPLQDVSQKRLQDIFKTSELFLQKYLMALNC